ncbi:MAG: aminotransferase class IV, partial [Armatimonadetes bacterium]|nr:aminotransferase class IV [Armatimonadota bacterium]
MVRASYIWFNGKVIPWGDAKIHILSHVTHYGSSVFEGIRAYATPRGPAAFCLKPHIDRFWDSCKIIRMPLPYTKEQITDGIKEIIRANGHQSCYIRPIAFRGLEVLGVDPRRCPVEVGIATWEWGRYLGPEAIEQGIDAGVSSWRRMAPD